MGDLLAIGEVARQSGTRVTTVRYYDEIGVIEAEARVGGKRRFSPGTIGRVSFIRRAQDVGFSLDEIRTILDEAAGEWADVVDGKLAELLDRRDRLDTMIGLLTELRECGCDSVTDCPRLDLAPAD